MRSRKKKLQKKSAAAAASGDGQKPKPEGMLGKKTPFNTSSFAEHLQENMLRHFTIETIEAATNGWSDERLIGVGGYGHVYLGTGHHESWAVKRATRTSNRGLLDFRNEVDVVSKINHRNLIRLIGFCDDNNEQILVYEYAPNGNLRQALMPNAEDEEDYLPPLTFNERLDIAVGAAEGLRYLHHFATPSIIHRDVKSENILLDADLQAKVSDFGFFKNVQQDKPTPKSKVSISTSTRVLGTPGYVDPEYFLSSKVTTKSDVYSFGVVLLELITGRLPLMVKVETETDPVEDATYETLATWAKPFIECGEVEELADPQLQGDYPREALMEIANIAMACLRPRSKDRPEMTTVLTRLLTVQREAEEQQEMKAVPEEAVDMSDASLMAELSASSTVTKGRKFGKRRSIGKTKMSDSEVFATSEFSPPVSGSFGGR